ncbi:hypothetical protein ACTXT7_017190, partial [Hymenolepis weldensis]
VALIVHRKSERAQGHHLVAVTTKSWQLATANNGSRNRTLELNGRKGIEQITVRIQEGKREMRKKCGSHSSGNGTSPENRIGEGFVRLYSETPLIRLPVPDFSMPFNALCLVCSVVALLFGAIHKFTTAPLLPAIAQGDEDEVDRSPIVRLIEQVKRFFFSWLKVEKPKKD